MVAIWQDNKWKKPGRSYERVGTNVLIGVSQGILIIFQ